MSQRLLAPPYGSITLPGLVDFHLEHNPDAIYAVFPTDEESESGPKASRVSFLEWTRAMHRVCHVIRPQQAGKSGEVVGLLLNTDTLMYATIILAVMRAGLTPYPMSHRNSPAAICHMLQTTSSHRIIATSASLEGLLSSVKAELSDISYDLQIDEMPSLQEIYPRLGHESATDPFTPYPKLESESLDDILFYLHSSGSTGFPKSIPNSNRSIGSWLSGPLRDDLALYPVPLNLSALPLPSFHMMGIFFQALYPLAACVSISIFEPKSPAPPVIPGPNNTLQAMKITGTNAMIIVPSWLELWADSEDALKFILTMEFTVFAGGPLSSKVGNKLSSMGVRLSSVYGATETGAVSTLLSRDRDPMDWDYLSICPHIDVRFDPQSDGTYELHVFSTEKHCLLVQNLPDRPGYATKDLFVKHPTKENLWKIVGRVDDVIILANGEKTVPLPMENKILSHSYVQAAVMFGRGRNQVGVLIELKPEYAINPADETALAEFRNAVWEVVEEANEDAPAFSRIFKEMILVTSPGKPMARTPKGSLMRKVTLAEYAQEIDELYAKVETSGGSDVDPPTSWTGPDLEEWLNEQAELINEVNKGTKLAPDVDLFAQGFDSLSATFLRNRIIGALRSSDDPAAKQAAPHIAQSFIFTNNTIETLSAAIRALILPSEDGQALKSPTAGIEYMISKYSKDLPQVGSGADQTSTLPAKAVVLLTGSTGGMGAYMLWMLLEDSKVERVYAFNRKSTKMTLAERQKEAFEDRGLPTSLLSSEKLTLVEGEDSSARLGLDDQLYEQLRTTCTHIIHNAWRLDFNLSISSFEPNIRGTRNLIDLALTSRYAPCFRFIFTSSVAVSQSWDEEKGPFPEEPDLPAEVAVGNGYGEGKYVSEQLLVRASKNGLQTSSLRIGQVCGGRPEGSWATTDWVAIFVKSSMTLGHLPDAQGVATWVPTDIVAQTILDITFASEPPPPALNIVHPRPVSWSSIMRGLSTALAKVVKGSKPPALLPPKDWVAKLEALANKATEDDIKKVPAIKLLPFFQHLARADEDMRMSGKKDLEAGGITRLSTQKTQAVSQTLREVGPVGEEHAEMWVKYWYKKGMF